MLTFFKYFISTSTINEHWQGRPNPIQHKSNLPVYIDRLSLLGLSRALSLIEFYRPVVRVDLQRKKFYKLDYGKCSSEGFKFNQTCRFHPHSIKMQTQRLQFYSFECMYKNLKFPGDLKVRAHSFVLNADCVFRVHFNEGAELTFYFISTHHSPF